MAAIRGDVGKIMFHNAGGTEADIAGTRSWSLSVSKDTLETTVQGNTSKTFVGGLISGEGSAELIYDNAGNSDYLAFVEDILKQLLSHYRVCPSTCSFCGLQCF